uniref:Electron transfer flavoprotein-ubiquinone oxidoreductase n=1 Tax=Stygiella incarcerata TaxID=1712417 RepID=A0A192ZIW8_9EUKA|nr:ETF-ubiquinone oxidoreductase 2 [Stygiella incarcerata]
MLCRGVLGGRISATFVSFSRTLSDSLFSTTPATSTPTRRQANKEFDVVIVGGSFSGLSAAIRLKQEWPACSVAVLEEAAQVGRFVLSGAVLEPRALDELLPSWRTEQPSCLKQRVRNEGLYWLPSQSMRIPLPNFLSDAGQEKYVIDPFSFLQWLSQRAESMGICMFSGVSATSPIYDTTSDKEMHVKGVLASPMADRKHEKEIRFQARLQTIFADGCSGCHHSISQSIMEDHKLNDYAMDDQVYAIGLKESWRILPEKVNPGRVFHAVGWPLQPHTFGGSFMYDHGSGYVSLGIVISKDEPRSELLSVKRKRNKLGVDPFQELQRLKHHPLFRNVIEGGECVSFGRRLIPEGGFQSMPKMSFPGGLLIGDAAGMVNVFKIKGIHTSMKSGIIAADVIAKEFKDKKAQHSGSETLHSFDEAIADSWIVNEDLFPSRNVRPAFKSTRLGLYGGMLIASIEQGIFHGRLPFTLRHAPRSTENKHALCHITYPENDGVISFDYSKSMTLRAKDKYDDKKVNLGR